MKGLKHFINHKNIFWGSRKSICGPKGGLKGSNFCKLLAKFDHLRSIEPRELDWCTIFLVYVMGNVVRDGFVGTSMQSVFERFNN